MRILLVEDEKTIADVIKMGLEDEHHSVDVASDGTQGFELAKSGMYGLMILDVMLPGTDGYAVCEALRARRNRIPILMLTARDSPDDRVRGLDLGADDYLSKPFSFNELLARVRALHRRDKINRSRIIRVADLEVDTARREVKRAGVSIHLTPREYSLLEALAMQEGAVVSREMILENVWTNGEAYPNTVDVYIAMLRKKIDAGHDVKLIHTVHRYGYTLEAAV